MKNRTTMVAGLVFVCITLAALAEPRIACDASDYDFGVRRDNETVVHQFAIKNTGDAPLAITRVKASCGCTVVKTSADSIAAGQTAFIEAKFSLKGRRGPQRKAITVESNDPVTPHLRLWLKGEIVTELAMQPSHLNFSKVHKDAVSTQTVALVSLRPDIRITAVKSDNPAFAATIDPDGRGLTVHTVPPMEEGFVRAQLEISTDHPLGLSTDLQVVGVVMGDLNVLPRDLILRASQPGPQRVALMVRPFSDTKFTVLKADFPQENVTVSFQPVADGSISVVLDGIHADEALNGKTIVIHTDLETAPELIVPIRVYP